MLGDLTFLAPEGALVAHARALPVLAVVAATARSRRAAAALGLRAPGAHRPSAAALAAMLAVGLLAAAAARPALAGEGRVVRTDSQVVFVVDVSRSMLAAAQPAGRTRLDRAQNVVRQLRAATANVPAALAGLTDRILPYVFPTADGSIFAETLERSVAVENPPPRDEGRLATTYAPLASLGRDGYFDRGIDHRACVLVTDGEVRPFSAGAIGRALRGSAGCRLFVVRVGERTDRVYGEDGLPEAEYRADPDAQQSVARLVAAAGGRAWEEGSVENAAEALRAAANVGPSARAPATRAPRELGVYLAGGALALAILAVGAPIRLRGPWARRESAA
jgi:hypothetical protein